MLRRFPGVGRGGFLVGATKVNLLDTTPRLVVALNVIEHFVGVEVGMVVRHNDRLRMEVKRSWAELADDEVVRLECLMRRWRHVVLGHDWAEVVDVEAVRVVAAVPAHNVKRVVAVHVRVHLVAALDAHLELALHVEGHRQLGQAQVAFAVGRVLKELRRLLRQVARRRQDVRPVHALHKQEARRGLACSRLLELHAVDRALRDHNVVLRSKLQRTEHRVNDARSEIDEEALVGGRILEVVLHRLLRDTHADFDIAVAKENGAPRHGVSLGLHRHALHVPHPHGGALDILDLGRVERFPAHHLGRWIDVVEGRRRADKAFCSKHLFRVEPAIWATELDVTLRGQRTEFGVVGHDETPRSQSVPREAKQTQPRKHAGAAGETQK